MFWPSIYKPDMLKTHRILQYDEGPLVRARMIVQSQSWKNYEYYRHTRATKNPRIQELNETCCSW